MGAAYDEMFDGGVGLRTPYSQLQPSLRADGRRPSCRPGWRRCSRATSTRASPSTSAARSGRSRSTSSPGSSRWTSGPRSRPASSSGCTTLEKFLDDVYDAGEVLQDGVVPRRVVTTSSHFHRQAAGIEPPNGVRVHVSGIDLIRDDAGEFRVLEDNVRVPVRGLLRDDQPARDRRRAARDLRRAPHPAGRRLPPAAAHRAARRRARRRHRPERRRAHPGRLQRRLLRARAAGPHHGRRAGRGPRPRVPARPRDDAYDAGPRAGARDLPPRGRRVPRPGALPQQLAARLLRA